MKIHSSGRVPVVAVWAAVGAASCLQGAVTWQTPLAGGDTLVTGVNFLSLDSNVSRAARLNASGQIAALGDVLSGGTVKRAVIQSSANGAAPWRLLAMEGDPAPGVAGSTVNSLTNGTLVESDSGAVLWNGTTKAGSAAAKGALWLNAGTGVALAIEGGNPAGSTTEVFTSLVGFSDRLRLSNAGLPLAVVGLARGSNYVETLCSGGAGQFGAVATAGDPQPSDPAGRVFGGVYDGSALRGGFLALGITDSGYIAFNNRAIRAANPSSFQESIWEKSPGGPLTARLYGPATAGGMPSGGIVLTEYYMELRAMASGGRLVLGQQTTLNNATLGNALFLSQPSTPLTFSAGWPGAIDVYTQVDFPGRQYVACSDSGRMASYFAVPAAAQGADTGYGLAVNGGSGWKFVALNNTPAPGMPLGVNYSMVGSGFESDIFFTPPALTPQGRLLFVTRLQGGNVTSANDRAIYIVQPDGTPELVLRKGDAVTSSRFTKTVTDFSLLTGSGGNDGLPRTFNDNGQIAVRLTYSGGSGIWLASAGATIPATTVTLPALTVSRSGNQVTLSWTTALTGIALETTTTLVAPWQTVTTAPTQVGNTYTVTLTQPGRLAFYRLKK